jgi:hypothetical protein
MNRNDEYERIWKEKIMTYVKLLHENPVTVRLWAQMQNQNFLHNNLSV